MPLAAFSPSQRRRRRRLRPPCGSRTSGRIIGATRRPAQLAPRLKQFSEPYSSVSTSIKPRYRQTLSGRGCEQSRLPIRPFVVALLRGRSTASFSTSRHAPRFRVATLHSYQWIAAVAEVPLRLGTPVLPVSTHTRQPAAH